MTDILNLDYFKSLAAEAELLFFHNDPQNPIRVYDHPKFRWLQFHEHDLQSAMDKSLPHKLLMPYAPAQMAALLFCDRPKHIYIAGLGGGDMVRFFQQALPKSHITAVERNPIVIEAYEQFFSKDCSHVNVRCGDVTTENLVTSEEIDFFVLDIFSPQGLAPLLGQIEFYTAINSALSESGMFVANMVVENNQQAVHILKILHSVFAGQVLCLSIEGHMNLIVIASKKKLELNTDVLIDRAHTLSGEIEHIDFEYWLKQIVSINTNFPFSPT